MEVSTILETMAFAAVLELAYALGSGSKFSFKNVMYISAVSILIQIVALKYF